MENEEAEKIKQRIANLEYLLIKNEWHPSIAPDYSFMIELGCYVALAMVFYYMFTMRKEIQNG